MDKYAGQQRAHLKYKRNGRLRKQIIYLFKQKYGSIGSSNNNNGHHHHHHQILLLKYFSFYV